MNAILFLKKILNKVLNKVYIEKNINIENYTRFYYNLIFSKENSTSSEKNHNN
jgi:hypothetical protein